MTRNEIVDFLHEVFNYRKGELTSIKSIVECAAKEGYIVEKIDKDEFSIKERCAISDFTKPFMIDRAMPDNMTDWELCNGVPIAHIVAEVWYGGYFAHGLWCYMSNQIDNYHLKVEQIVPNIYETIEDLVKSFDAMTSLGYFEETEDYIIFHMYPKRISGRFPQKYVNGEIGRFAPIKY